MLMVHSACYFQGVVLDKKIFGVFSSYFSVSCPYHKFCIDQPSEYSLLSNKFPISIFHKMNSPIKKYVLLLFCGCFIQQFHSELNIYLRWKRIDISWMTVGNYASCTKSDFYEIVNVITNFFGELLSVKCDFWVGLAWLWNSLNNERCGLF